MHRTQIQRRSAQARPGGPASPSVPAAEDPKDIDARYGLEPVFEPGDDSDNAVLAEDDARGTSCLQKVHCPYCGEPFETLVDLSAGSAEYIEDCPVCCRPIQFDLEVDHDGQLIRLTAGRD